MVFAPVFLSEGGEDFLRARAATCDCPPPSSARYRSKDATLLRQHAVMRRSRRAHTLRRANQKRIATRPRAAWDRRPSTTITPANRIPHGASTQRGADQRSSP